MIMAGKIAGQRGIPIVLDPVGSGATPLRTEAVKRILAEIPVTVIRGNASEVMSLFSKAEKIKIRGVDSLETVDAVRYGAHTMAAELKKVIAITGEIDFVTNGDSSVEIHNGHHMFSRVTGTGCAATTAISCFVLLSPILLLLLQRPLVIMVLPVKKLQRPPMDRAVSRWHYTTRCIAFPMKQ